MNDPSMDAAAAARQQELNRQQTHSGLVLFVVTAVTLFILPRYLTPPYDGMLMGFGSAAILTIFVYLYPKSFRSRGGSLVPALCLVAALWLLAAVTAVLSIVG